MKFLPKTNLTQRFSHRPAGEIDQQSSPGPGSYDIALPMIRPNWQAIKKRNNIIILKVNNNNQSHNFKSQQPRFPAEKQRSPGPARYNNNNELNNQYSLNLRKREQHQKKYSQRYSDLIDFMYKDRVKISSVPQYTVEYDKEYSKILKRIKNSHRKYKEKLGESTLDALQKNMNRKNSIQSIQTIVNIRSSSKLSDYVEELSKALDQKTMDDQHLIYQQNAILNEDQIIMHQNDQHLDKKNATLQPSQMKTQNTIKENEQTPKGKKYRTIDLPQQSSKMQSKRKNLSMEKQQKLVLHRATLYNRNMLGMIMAKNTSRSRVSSINASNIKEQTKNKQKNKQSLVNFSVRNYKQQNNATDSKFIITQKLEPNLNQQHEQTLQEQKRTLQDETKIDQTIYESK